MKYIINDQVVLSRVPEGALAEYFSPFAESLRREGYARATIERQVMLAACFSRWLERTGVHPERVASSHPALYLRTRYRQLRRIRGDRGALDNFVEFLRREAVIPAEKTSARRLTPIEQYVQAYEQYLRKERLLAEATIQTICHSFAGSCNNALAVAPPGFRPFVRGTSLNSSSAKHEA